MVRFANAITMVVAVSLPLRDAALAMAEKETNEVTSNIWGWRWSVG